MSCLLFLGALSQCRPVDSCFGEFLYYAVFPYSGQVAQLVERGPEKAGVGGSIPSLATILFNNLAIAKKRVRISRAHNTRTSVASDFTFGAARSSNFPNETESAWMFIVNKGSVVGHGFHRYADVKHAEVLALEQAGSLASGGTLYVNLEPCCHRGGGKRNPP